MSGGCPEIMDRGWINMYNYINSELGSTEKMPIFWAVVCGVLFTLFLFTKGFSLKGLTILLLPLYFAVRNLDRQRRLEGDWAMRWPKFWEAILLAGMLIGIPLFMIFINEPSFGFIIILGIWIYIIFTAISYGITKKQKAPADIDSD